MKKVFMSAFALSSLALSTFALASCGGSKEAEVKDLDGNSYKIAATEDSEAVSKALVLAANQVYAGGDEKIYAIGFDSTASCEISFSTEGIKGTIKGENKANGGATIGTKTYVDPTLPESKDVDFAKELKENLSFLVSENLTAKFSDFSIDETYESFENSTEEELSKAKSMVSSLNGTAVDYSAKLYTNDGFIYAETDAVLPEAFTNTFTQYASSLSAFKDKNVKMPYSIENPEEVAIVLHNYQTMTQASFMDEYMPLILASANVSLPAIKFDDKFFESKEYQTLVNMVKTLGVKVSNVNNGDVTFEVNVTEKEVIEFAKTLENEDFVKIAEYIFKGEKSLLDLSFTINVTNGRVVSLKVSLDTLDVIPTLVQAVLVVSFGGAFNPNKTVDQLLESMEPLPFTLSGKLSLEANFKYNKAVNATQSPASNKTYVEVEDFNQAFSPYN